MAAAGTLAPPVPGGGWQNGLVGGGARIANPGPAGAERWLLAASIGGNGGIHGGTDPTGNGADVASCAGPLTFRSHFASTADIRMEDVEFAFRARSVGATGESPMCDTRDAAGSSTACEPCVRPTVTPEPATVVPMASGPLGVVGVARRRRRIARRSPRSRPSAHRHRRAAAGGSSPTRTGGSLLSSRSARSTVPPAPSAPSTM